MRHGPGYGSMFAYYHSHGDRHESRYGSMCKYYQSHGDILHSIISIKNLFTSFHFDDLY